MKDIKVAIIGFGGMGKLYAEKIYKGEINHLKLAGVCCRNEKGQQFISQNYQNVEIYNNEDEMFNKFENFDALIIATPHKEHVRCITRALQLNKHVLCEKPISVTTSEINEIKKLKNTTAKFAMIFNWRARPVYKKLKQMLAENCLGELNRVVWIANLWYRTPYYHSMAPWRSSWATEGGGLLINQMQHVFDIWQWLFGMPKSVLANVEFGKYSNITVDDSAEMIFEGENGLRGICTSSSGESPGSNYLEIHGTYGKIVVDYDEIKLYKNKISTTEFAKRNDGVYTGIPFEEIDVAVEKEKELYSEYVEILQNFANGIAFDEPLIAQGLSGENAVQMANACYLSAWQSKKVCFPIDEKCYDKMLAKKIFNEANR